MTRIAFSRLIAGAVFSLCLATVPAWALNDRTYVSGKGADTGACTTPPTACRTFAFAIGQTAASGTIIAIDPANYGPVTITKSISIVADGGGPAGIFITSGTAITINQGSAIVNVNLRGLTLDGSGTASAGIAPVSITSGAVNVTITDCFIRHFNGDGIVVGASSTQFLVANTVSADNSGRGLSIIGLSGNLGVVDHFTARGNKVGIFGGNGTFGIADSVIVDNASKGLHIAIVGPILGRATLAGSV